MLHVSRISKSFQFKYSATDALKDCSLSIGEREFVSIIGPSGCGKSTLLNTIAGLIDPDEGDVIFRDQSIVNRTGEFGYMPQQDVLFPWRTILDNVILPLEINGLNRKEAKERANPYFEKFGLEGFQYQYPRALSGGMRQRANFLRAVLPAYPLLLLDEPFGRLDALTRSQLQQWLLQTYEELQASLLLITHDIEEAILLSDRIYVMSSRPGTIIEEVRVPYARPRNREVLYEESFSRLKKQITEYLHG
ncbi:ABC transporter [Pontibacillus halophilus JSM 076056 = DSM 19796]|uniref:ABC transporter n=1 Tax=Pontibacillus halophilus JSM 076056 = DSM 19796 TaxID=1385510 RepID=A0A0A5GJJ8_9BACI|nr:ABC transporter ATP-binding protein [Pontibacillus halophilus]KGX91330.1 ABC transporter [Pontibacillus halophilus JSM 076056 = DSM 19796]